MVIIIGMTLGQNENESESYCILNGKGEGVSGVYIIILLSACEIIIAVGIQWQQRREEKYV